MKRMWSKEELTEEIAGGHLYVHKISWKYTSNTANVFKYYLSTKPTPYSSMLDIFAHLGTTNLTHSEIVEYGDKSAILKFGDAGAVLSGVAIGVDSKQNVSTFAMAASAFSFDKDEVVSNWGA